MKRIEASVLGLTFLVVIVFFWSLLSGESAPTHDHLRWHYVAFHFFFDHLLNGELPLWNPYTNGGEPFYPHISQMRLYDPLLILSGLVGSLFTDNLLVLFNWTRVIAIWVMGLGSYLLIRLLIQPTAARVILIPVIFFSSFLLGWFQQDGIMHQFLWVPYGFYFLLKIFWLGDTRWVNWAGLTAVLGLSLHSYWFLGLFSLMGICVVGLCFADPKKVLGLFQVQSNNLKMLGCIVLLAAMATPNFVMFTERNKFVYPLRAVHPERYEKFLRGEVGPRQGAELMESHSLAPGGSEAIMDYSRIQYSGAFSRLWDFWLIPIPIRDQRFHESNIFYPLASPEMSESYILLGVLPWFLALFGFFFGTHPLKRTFGAMWVLTAWLMLGPTGGLHQWLCEVLPIFLIVRNTHCFVGFFHLFALFFIALGTETLWKQYKLIPQT